MNAPERATIRIRRMIVYTDRPLHGLELQAALGDALQRMLTGRGLPWQEDRSIDSLKVDWDGRGGAPGLAHAVAVCLPGAADPTHMGTSP